jgi:hypothetical protein
MSELASALLLAGGLVTAMTLIGSAAVWLFKPHIAKWVLSLIAPMQQQVAETHTQVTVNGGKSDPPTLRDQICILTQRFDDHMLVSERDSADLQRVKRQVGMI